MKHFGTARTAWTAQSLDYLFLFIRKHRRCLQADCNCLKLVWTALKLPKFFKSLIVTAIFACIIAVFSFGQFYQRVEGHLRVGKSENSLFDRIAQKWTQLFCIEFRPKSLVPRGKMSTMAHDTIERLKLDVLKLNLNSRIENLAARYDRWYLES